MLATSPAAMHQSALFSQLTDALTVVTHDPQALSSDDVSRLQALGIDVVEGPVSRVLGSAGRLTGVEVPGRVLDADAVVVASFVEATSPVLTALGLQPEDLEMMGRVMARSMPADAVGRTTVPRVWAAGNVGAIGHVWAVDGTSGAVVQDTVVPESVFLNDLVVTGDSVWVTDSRIKSDRLTRLQLTATGAPTGAAPTFVPLGGAWPQGDGVAVNANGIRALPDGSLILNNSRVGGLWQVSPATGVAVAIPVTGGPGIVAGDGLELDGRTLYNVRGSGQYEVSVLELTPTGSTWVAAWRGARTDETLDIPSTATLAGGWLWAVNARFGVASPGTASYWVTRLPAR